MGHLMPEKRGRHAKHLAKHGRNRLDGAFKERVLRSCLNHVSLVKHAYKLKRQILD